MTIRRRLIKLLEGPQEMAPPVPRFPVSGRHRLDTTMVSIDDDPAAKGSDRIFDLSVAAIQAARGITLQETTKRISGPPYYTEIWPGEHYRLIAAFVEVMKPKVVIEIGTYSGLSALSMLKTLPTNSKIVTFDIVDWKEIPITYLNEQDFVDGRLEQRLGDLADIEVMEKNRGLLEAAELMFIDGPKEGDFERVLLENFTKLNFVNPPLLVFDDIRVTNMLQIWRDIKRPKLDLTSFGHWSGTGLVDWS